MISCGGLLFNKIISRRMSQRHQPGYMPHERTGNRILVKSELAKNKPTNYEIPEPNFVYGDPTYEDPEHAVNMMYEWQYHNPSANHNDKKVKDLIETNKLCLKDQLHTSNQFYDYRKSKTLFKTAREGSKVVKIQLPEETHAYGKPLDLEDPVKLVIANSYGEDDLRARHTFYQTRNSNYQVPLRKLSCHITKNHQLVKEATAKRLEKFTWGKKEEPWKISKFTSVGFKVETRRPRTVSQL